MAIELSTYLAYAAFVGFAAFGAATRAVFGIYKAYMTYPEFTLEKARIGIEIIASIFFGTFAVFLLQQIGGLNFGLNIAAMVGGFFGADLIYLITKKLGLSKSLQVVVSRQQMGVADLNDRQIRALEYLKDKRKITNRIYQKINQTGPNVAKKDLHALVKKGKFAKLGQYKGAYYTLREDRIRQQNRTGRF